MRRAARVDANQADIVHVLRRAGATVQLIHVIGDGCPDLLVGWRGRNLLLEVKDGSRPPSERCLTPDEERWHALWRGQVAVVTCEREALALLDPLLRRQP